MVAEIEFLQFGGLGLAALISITSLKYSYDANENMQAVISKNSEAIMRLSETIATCPKKR